MNSDRTPLEASASTLNGAKLSKIVRFDPIVSMGTLIQILVIVVGGVGVYGTYSADQTRRDMRVEQVAKDLDSNRNGTRDTLLELRSDVKDLKSDIKDVQHQVTDTSQTVAVLKARSDPIEKH
jgi:septal ring factor EnvC (AmiA/AmiB activator)